MKDSGKSDDNKTSIQLTEEKIREKGKVPIYISNLFTWIKEECNNKETRVQFIKDNIYNKNALIRKLNNRLETAVNTFLNVFEKDNDY